MERRGAGDLPGPGNGHVYEVSDARGMDGTPHARGITQVFQHIGPTLSSTEYGDIA